MTSSSSAAPYAARATLSPLIKWPGGKRALVKHIVQFVPDIYGTYYEPFLGGGAVFFALQPRRAVLSDANPELINAYVQVRDAQEDLLRALRQLKNTEKDYYEIRQSAPTTPVCRASRMLYLTRLAFNGIHRVNRKGEFNVPYGHKTHLHPVDEAHLISTSAALRGVDLQVGDFEAVTRSAQKGDVLYFDPPYTVAHATNGFVKYNERIFSWADQERLAKHARELAERGCRVIVSNADHPSLRGLYADFSCHVVQRHSVISASGIHRRQITECIFVLGDV